MRPHAARTPAAHGHPLRDAKRVGRVPAGVVVWAAAFFLAFATQSRAGVVSGTVRYEGLQPERPTIYMTADPACDKVSPNGRPSEVLVVDPATRGLQNVIVHVKAGLEKGAQWELPPATPRIDQRGCVYVPHVIAVRVGQEVQISSSDPTLHNVNARTANNTPFNIALPGAQESVHRTFTKPELAVKLKCDIHPWMVAYVGVFDHPFYAVSGPDGRFMLPLLPEGDYTLEAWHESLGTRQIKVSVDDDKPVTADFSFAGN